MLSKYFLRKNFSIFLNTKYSPLCTKILFEHSRANSFSEDQRKKFEDETEVLVSIEESRRFMVDCFTAVKVPQGHAEQMADVLVAADYRGHFSHGMNRLEMYINDLQNYTTDGTAIPKILSETVATAWVDGCNGLGAVIGNYCMDLAIKKAKEVGIGWICVKNSNHFGIAGWYTLQAVKNDLIGIAMTNTSPFMAPTRSKVAALGTNPIAISAPAKDDIFVLDMATTTAAIGKIEMQIRKNQPIADGWAQDYDGHMTNNAQLAYQVGCLMPLGGAEINGGYKGYGLGAMVDILCGVMSGANYATKIRKWGQTDAKETANLGQLFAAIDPNRFAPGFKERLSDFNGILRKCLPSDPDNRVLVPGDKEELNMRSVNEVNGINYIPNQLKTCKELSERLHVKALRNIET